MNVKNLFLAAIVQLVPMTVCADSIPSTWSYRQCVDYAYQNNISLKKQELAHESGLVNTEAANAQWLPTLNFATTQGVARCSKLCSRW